LKYLFILFVLISQSISAQYQEGDLLFQDCDCGDMCNAIEEVTTSKNNARFSHIALVVKNDEGQLQALEANVNGVVMVPINDFVNRYKSKEGNPTIAIGRLEEKYLELIPDAISYAKSMLGMPYDTVFLMHNKMYYCSELIYEAFRFANNNRDFFKLYPMTFKDKKTNQTHPAFDSYYKNMKRTIPEGKMGINPGSISRDSRLSLSFLY
jgi:hypothetical protein